MIKKQFLGTVFLLMILMLPMNVLGATDSSYFEFDKEKGLITSYKYGGPKDVVIPSEIDGVKVVEVKSSAFYQMGLNSVVIPDTVVKIGSYGFAGNNLQSVVIPNSVIQLGEFTFSDNKLKSVEISENLKLIEIGTFYKNKLENVTIGDNINNIRLKAFAQNNLKNVDIPNSVVSISEEAFYQNNIEKIVIPKSVTEVQRFTFPSFESFPMTTENLFKARVVDSGVYVVMISELSTKSYDTKLSFNGRFISLEKPIINKYDRTYYPMRELIETMGGKVEWNNKEKIAEGTLNGTTIGFRVDSNNYYVNGKEYILSDNMSTFLDSDSTYVPIRVTAEALGYKVGWDDDSKMVTIYSDKTIEARVNEKTDNEVKSEATIKENIRYINSGGINIDLFINGYEGMTDAGAYEEIVNEYTSVNEDINVNMFFITDSYLDGKESLRQIFENNGEPDIINYNASIGDKIDLERLVSIDEIRKQYPDYGKNARDFAMDIVAEEDGQTYGLPFTGYMEGLYVNVDLFEEHGLELPTTWRNLEKAIEYFNRNGITPIAASFSDSSHYWIENSIMSAGGVKGHSMKLDKVGEIPESWTLGLNIIKEVYEKDGFNSDVFETDYLSALNLFNKKKAGMLADGSWLVKDIKDKENTIFMPFPSYKNKSNESIEVVGMFSNNFYITRKAWEDESKRDEIIKLVEELTSSNSINKLSKGGVFISHDIIDSDIVNTNLEKSVFDLSNRLTNISKPVDLDLEEEAYNNIMKNIEKIANDEVEAIDILKESAEINNN